MIPHASIISVNIKKNITIRNKFLSGSMNGLIASTFWLHKNGGLVETISKFIDEGGSW